MKSEKNDGEGGRDRQRRPYSFPPTLSLITFPPYPTPQTPLYLCVSAKIQNIRYKYKYKYSLLPTLSLIFFPSLSYSSSPPPSLICFIVINCPPNFVWIQCIEIQCPAMHFENQGRSSAFLLKAFKKSHLTSRVQHIEKSRHILSW